MKVGAIFSTVYTAHLFEVCQCLNVFAAFFSRLSHWRPAGRLKRNRQQKPTALCVGEKKISMIVCMFIVSHAMQQYFYLCVTVRAHGNLTGLTRKRKNKGSLKTLQLNQFAFV